MARGRISRSVGELVSDEVRCTRMGKGWRCVERRRVGTAMCDYHHTLCRRPRSQRRPRRANSPIKPLNYYMRRKSFPFGLGAGRDLQPDTPSSLPPAPAPAAPAPAPILAFSSSPVQDSLNAVDNNSRDKTVNSDNQNPSSVVEDPSTVSANAGTNEGAPFSEASVSALPNSNASPSPNANSNLFQKTPSIWQAVEKLEVFGQVPQQPHFMKLQR